MFICTFPANTNEKLVPRVKNIKNIVLKCQCLVNSSKCTLNIVL